MGSVGENLKKIRKARRLSLKELAEISNCSPSFLSMVENGKVDISVSRLHAIANGLGYSIIDLLQDENIHDTIVMRKNKRPPMEIARSKLRVEPLIPAVDEKHIDARMHIIQPGGSSEGYYKHPGEEFGFILKGRLEIVVDGTKYQLEEGDSFFFLSTRDHSWKNINDKETRVLWINYGSLVIA